MVEWIEMQMFELFEGQPFVSTLVVEWIEISAAMAITPSFSRSPPSWWSGLKLLSRFCKVGYNKVSTLVVEWIEIYRFSLCNNLRLSPPSWWSGLKFIRNELNQVVLPVSTLVVEWIEMVINGSMRLSLTVSTLVVEWIEISIKHCKTLRP